MSHRSIVDILIVAYSRSSCIQCSTSYLVEHTVLSTLEITSTADLERKWQQNKGKSSQGLSKPNRGVDHMEPTGPPPLKQH